MPSRSSLPTSAADARRRRDVRRRAERGDAVIARATDAGTNAVAMQPGGRDADHVRGQGQRAQARGARRGCRTDGGHPGRSSGSPTTSTPRRISQRSSAMPCRLRCVGASRRCEPAVAAARPRRTARGSGAGPRPGRGTRGASKPRSTYRQIFSTHLLGVVGDDEAGVRAVGVLVGQRAPSRSGPRCRSFSLRRERQRRPPVAVA